MLFEVRVILGNWRNIYPGHVLNTGEHKHVSGMQGAAEVVLGLGVAFSDIQVPAVYLFFLSLSPNPREEQLKE